MDAGHEERDAPTMPPQSCGSGSLILDVGKGRSLETWWHHVDEAVVTERGMIPVPANPGLAACVTPQLREEQQRFWSYLQLHDPQRCARAQAAAQAWGPPRLPPDSLDAVVAVAVAGHEDAGRIGPYIDLLASQTAADFELCLFVNAPADDPAEECALRIALARTVRQVERSRRRWRRLHVRCLVGVYRGATPTMGVIRADLWDAVAFDFQTRGRRRDILVISQDIDTIAMSRDYVARMVEASSRGPFVVSTPVQWGRVPGLPRRAVANRVMDAAGILYAARDLQRGVHHVWDGSVGFSLAAYLAAGGYQYVHTIGESNNVARAIRDLCPRAPDGAPVHVHTEEPWIVSDSRRQVACMAHGCSPFSAWKSEVLPFGIRDAVRSQRSVPARVEHCAKELGAGWVLERIEQLLAATPADRRSTVEAFLRTRLRTATGFEWSAEGGAAFR